MYMIWHRHEFELEPSDAFQGPILGALKSDSEMAFGDIRGIYQELWL